MNQMRYNLSYKQHFYKQRQAEMSKNQAKAKQHLEAEHLLFENSSITSNNNRRYSKKFTKKQIRSFKRTCIIRDNENEAENECYMMVIFIKQHLSNI